MDSTKFQDCNVITAAFERGAHFNSDEASIYAPLSKRVQNIKSAAITSQKLVNNYKTQPTAPKTVTNGLSGQTGFSINNQTVNIPSDKKSTDILSRATKDCIPCNFRPLLSLDLNISQNLLNSLKVDVTSRLNILNSIKDMLTNINFYGDYCQMVSFLNFICIPDLQRIAMVLASLLMDYGSGLHTLTGLLQGLIAPLFLPVLMSLNGMMDKLVQLVLNPINCIITSVEENIRKLNVGTLVGDNTLNNLNKEVSQVGHEANIDVQQFQNQVRFGLIELHSRLNEGNTSLRNKLDFYVNQLDKLLKQHSNHDIKYMSTANNKLIVVRLIALVRAMIKARQGGFVCNTPNSPGPSELDNFFNKFLSPNTPFNITVDKDGNLRLEEKLSSKPITGISINSQPLLTPNKFTPLNKTLKCKFNTSQNDVDKVNNWISQLDNTGVTR